MVINKDRMEKSKIWFSGNRNQALIKEAYILSSRGADKFIFVRTKDLKNHT